MPDSGIRTTAEPTFSDLGGNMFVVMYRKFAPTARSGKSRKVPGTPSIFAVMSKIRNRRAATSAVFANASRWKLSRSLDVLYCSSQTNVSICGMYCTT